MKDKNKKSEESEKPEKYFRDSDKELKKSIGNFIKEKPNSVFRSINLAVHQNQKLDEDDSSKNDQ